MLVGNSIQVDAKGVWIVRLDQRQACPVGDLGASIEIRLVAVRPHPETETGVVVSLQRAEVLALGEEPASTARRLWALAEHGEHITGEMPRPPVRKRFRVGVRRAPRIKPRRVRRWRS